MESLVIGLTGYSGSGKTTFYNVASKRYNISTLSTGDIVRAELQKRSLERNIDNVKTVIDWIYARGGFLAMLSKQITGALDADSCVIIDSIKTMRDFKEFSDLYKKRVLIGIIAEDQVRRNRITARKRVGVPASGENFRKLIKFENELGVGEVLSHAGYTIINNSTLEKFQDKSLFMLSKILGR
ncbi:AAA family ATPase [Candidatus Marsarchaeota archaeon]|jgi:dephospho-CoA kinase|nr:AAA family ATPase [Candidatus Marsarchaeota archaeon]